MFTHKKMANFLHYVPYAIHGYGHCVSCLFSCLVPKPKYTTSLPAEASAQAGGTSRSLVKLYGNICLLGAVIGKYPDHRTLSI